MVLPIDTITATHNGFIDPFYLNYVWAEKVGWSPEAFRIMIILSIFGNMIAVAYTTAKVK